MPFEGEWPRARALSIAVWDSTRITSAPISASRAVDQGPAMTTDTSKTLMPARGPLLQTDLLTPVSANFLHIPTTAQKQQRPKRPKTIVKAKPQSAAKIMPTPRPINSKEHTQHPVTILEHLIFIL